MGNAIYSMPLVGIDAVALDTETTGLDAKTARVVQIGSVRISGGVLREDQRLDRLVNPGSPIPPRSSEVHGIRDQDVVGAPSFGEAIPELEAFIARTIVVGHTIDYDLAVLRREYQIAGRAWNEMRSLDLRHLARLAAPGSARYDLDGICEALGIRIEGRHTAIGDALAAGRAFVALVPLLKKQGIHTLSELAAALRALSEREAAAGGGLFAASLPLATDRVHTLVKVDSFPYRHRVREVMSSPAITAHESTTIREAATMLVEKRISSLLIPTPGKPHGIVTERDVLRAIAAHGPAALERPISEILSRPLLTVEQDAFVYRAIGRMDRLSIRHLGVVDDEGALVGALTTRNLLRHRATTSMMLGDKIDTAEDAATIATAWSQLPLMARMLLDEQVDSRVIAGVISSEIAAITRRAAQFAEQKLAAEGLGGPPVPYTVLVLGSGGRGESLLAADQDNAIVYAEGEPEGPLDRWFERLGKEISSSLDAIGIHFCKGGVMASNSAWRMSKARWLETVDRWVRRQKPADLLNVDIFFDAVSVHGDKALAEEVLAHAFAVARRTPPFLVLLTETARSWRVPKTLFGKLRTDSNGRIDLKMHGLLPLVSGARMLAINSGIRQRGTVGRLEALAGERVFDSDVCGSLVTAHGTIVAAILAQQLLDCEKGIPLSPRVALTQQSRQMQDQIRQALAATATIRDLVSEGRF